MGFEEHENRPNKEAIELRRTRILDRAGTVALVLGRANGEDCYKVTGTPPAKLILARHLLHQGLLRRKTGTSQPRKLGRVPPIFLLRLPLVRGAQVES